MRRVLVVFALLAVAAGVASAASKPSAQLRAFVCKRALEPRDRLISVTALMHSRPGTKRMEMKFELLERLKGGAGETPVTGGDLGSWLAPRNSTLGTRPGDVWILRHPVKDLAGPAHYHFRVSFRWVGARRRVLAAAVRTGRTCFEPERRADLVVESVQVKPGGAGGAGARYEATIRNQGDTAAGHFQVWFSSASGTIKRSEPGLRAHRTLHETFDGPACNPASPPSVTADPTREVDDANRNNNLLTAKC